MLDNVSLTRTEEAALRKIEKHGPFPREAADTPPYMRLLRVNMIKLCCSEEFPPPKNYSMPGITTLFVYNAVCISDMGISYLAERRQKKREFRKNALVAFASAIAGAIITLLVTNISGIAVFFQELFQKG